MPVEKLFVRATFRDLAVFEDDDEVAVVDGAQSVGDEDGRALLVLEDAVDVLQQGLLGMRVECGGCFVEEQKWRVLQDESRDC